MTNRVFHFFYLFTIIAFIKTEEEVGLRWCSAPEQHSHQQLCDCNEDNLPSRGRSVFIDCSYKELGNDNFASFGDDLPLFTSTLDVSWNELTNLPSFNGDTLIRLRASHNNLTRINENNFSELPELKELDLSWNSIVIISSNAFYKLDHLSTLNLAHNNLKLIPNDVFFYLPSLQSLSLSWNPDLYQQKDFTQNNIFYQFGLAMTLKELKLDNCNIDGLDLTASNSLEHLSLRGNKFKTIPKTIPKSLKYLDISENPIYNIQPLNNLTNIDTLYIEDMSNLYKFNSEEFPSFGRKLKYLSGLNSKKLQSFAIRNSSDFPLLETLNLCGTMVRRFNSTIMELFQKLKEVNLNGIPFTCDCDLVWMKELAIETNAQCYRPSNIHGMRISSVRKEDFGCDPWPNWVYGILIFVLIVLCSVGIWLVVMGLRPFRSQVQMRGNNRIGSASPYARVTIEPSRADKMLF